MADDTTGLMNAMAIERAIILGISLGGRTALALTLAHPQRVERLVLVSTSARVLPQSWRFRALGLLFGVRMLRVHIRSRAMPSCASATHLPHLTGPRG
jgi:pimeloyl-ACP methyl ester carboxylesterase